ncbi:MAG TPA: hypothetical protein GXX75_03665 [Clostridiales bacterium]|nr:hypothetical protein [Clostridiales bacterium]
MLQNLYDNNIVIYTFAGLGGFGLLLRLIVNLVYKHLMKESDQLGETKNKMLKHIKLKFSTCYKLKIGVNNVDTFVDKNLLKYRFCGLLLSTWENLCGQVLYLILLMVPIITVFAVLEDCGQDQILMTGTVGILSAAVLILVDKSINLPGKKKVIRLNLLDYLENFCKVRLEQETANPELIEQYRREYFQVAELHNKKAKSGVFRDKRSETAAALETEADSTRDELSRRREAKLRKQEEKRLQAARREEEQRRLQEQRRAEEQRRLEERREQAARRREEERLKLEEEREALEARRAQLKKKAEQKHTVKEEKQKQQEEKELILHSMEEDLKPVRNHSSMEDILQGAEEIAAAQELGTKARTELKGEQEKLESSRLAKSQADKPKLHTMDPQEEKLIEDVLREFFA